MKKKEIRWISRDRSGIYACWKEKPTKNNHGAYNGMTYIPASSGDYKSCRYLEITLKKESLAKVTIERQY